MRGSRIARRLGSLFGATTPDAGYECSNCARTFDEWPGNCTDCGQVVVRVVDARPVPDLQQNR